METLTISEILQATNGTLICGNKEEIITNVSTNSKDVSFGSLFIPIIGERFDAHKFINSALNSGAVATICSDIKYCNKLKTWILVKDTKDALQNIAAYYRAKFNIPIIGVTGSVGKTSTKEMISSVLSTKKNVLKTKANLNSQIGLPLTVLEINKSHDLAVIEMGMSMFGEMSKLSKIAKPTIAVITNIGISHIENLKSQENILSEKIHIADYVKDNGTVYLNGDDPLLWDIKNKLTYKTKTFGLSKRNDIHPSSTNCDDKETKFTVNINGKLEEFFIHAIGSHHILNALAAVAIALDLNYSVKDIKSGISSFKPLKMRQEIYKTENGITIIDDSYNASPDSITSGLSVLNLFNTNGEKVAVLADMLELGKYSLKAHFDLGKTAVNLGITNIITIGEMAKQIAAGAKKINPNCKTKSFSNNNDAILYIKSILKSGDIVLVKGSRGMKTDEIVTNLKS